MHPSPVVLVKLWARQSSLHIKRHRSCCALNFTSGLDGLSFHKCPIYEDMSMTVAPVSKSEVGLSASLLILGAQHPICLCSLTNVVSVLHVPAYTPPSGVISSFHANTQFQFSLIPARGGYGGDCGEGGIGGVAGGEGIAGGSDGGEGIAGGSDGNGDDGGYIGGRLGTGGDEGGVDGLGGGGGDGGGDGGGGDSGEKKPIKCSNIRVVVLFPSAVEVLKKLAAERIASPARSSRCADVTA